MINQSEIKTVLSVFKDGIKYYFQHFGEFSKYMLFPVFGQLLGLGVIAITTIIYLTILPNLIAKYSFFNNTLNLILTSIAITIPGLAILLRAFWNYLAAYGVLSSITANMVKSGNIYDIPAHKELINQNAFQYILLWILYGIFMTLAFVPIFWIPAIILFIFFILIFQVFTFEEKPNAIKVFEISFKMIQGHFTSTLILAALVGLFSFIIIPNLICWAVSFIHTSSIILGLFNVPNETILFSPINLTAEAIYKFVESFSLSSIIIMFLLPIRSITWTLWYKKLLTGYKREQRKISKATTKLDQRIIDRAMEDYS